MTIPKHRDIAIHHTYQKERLQIGYFTFFNYFVL
uniref:Uncharacterized protein n=1 Tax=Siphoviridae sp. ct9mC1 TaxID=2827794 RepID=A0A8S5SEL3_9CAUD|nr:MAG TPA: hypothetical protein [Siphoviridae sp. ct9mC1]